MGVKYEGRAVGIDLELLIRVLLCGWRITIEWRSFTMNKATKQHLLLLLLLMIKG